MMTDTMLLQILLGLVAGGFVLGSVGLAIGCRMLASIARDVNEMSGFLQAKLDYKK